MAGASRQLRRFIASHSRKGKSCAECNLLFTADGGDGKGLAVFPNGAGGFAFYVLCCKCGAGYKQRGQIAIPNVARDAKITALMSPHSPKAKAPVWIH